jgi:hypothetical protein
VLSEKEIADLLMEEEDDDELGTMSLDDDDGDDEGIEEPKEVILDQLPVLTPPPGSPTERQMTDVERLNNE